MASAQLDSMIHVTFISAETHVRVITVVLA